MLLELVEQLIKYPFVESVIKCETLALFKVVVNELLNRGFNFTITSKNSMKQRLNVIYGRGKKDMIAIHGRYYQKNDFYIISGYTVSKTYDSSYSEVLKVCKQFVNPVAIIDLKLTKVPKSALTNLETASFHCTVKFKKGDGNSAIVPND